MPQLLCRLPAVCHDLRNLLRMKHMLIHFFFWTFALSCEVVLVSSISLHCAALLRQRANLQDYQMWRQTLYT